MAITDYKIITANSAENLQNKVADAIAEDWQPLGGAVVVPGPEPYAQALAAGSVVLVGEKGDTGATGATGSTGATGPQGPLVFPSAHAYIGDVLTTRAANDSFSEAVYLSDGDYSIDSITVVSNGAVTANNTNNCTIAIVAYDISNTLIGTVGSITTSITDTGDWANKKRMSVPIDPEGINSLSEGDLLRVEITAAASGVALPSFLIQSVFSNT